MATLLVINGPPGIGKTTTAQELAVGPKPRLRLDVDEIRALIVGWEQVPQESGAIARVMVTEMAATYLGAGGDVIVSQLYGRLPDLVRLEEVALGAGATFVEVVLMTDIDDARERFIARGGDKLDDLQGADGSLPGFDELYQRVVGVLADRPRTLEIRSTRGDPEAATAAVRAAAGWDPSPRVLP